MGGLFHLRSQIYAPISRHCESQPCQALTAFQQNDHSTLDLLKNCRPSSHTFSGPFNSTPVHEACQDATAMCYPIYIVHSSSTS